MKELVHVKVEFSFHGTIFCRDDHDHTLGTPGFSLFRMFKPDGGGGLSALTTMFKEIPTSIMRF